ncbi:carboxylating nicotinate-nucleotide diphosphorylase [Candidatus Nitrosotalea okcheonensis]|uniref:Nicotinate-nucleotide pyrophosphorylase [carboxylating] n=1 Tax=Candidatus Nitrosotalea okcheonensis TaxID=1903276 RepID=A0A2H1FCW8_9ARCH|nr:carboxylating nicotinate-nucleotide diphosphorylase [Candidatus Nitrosotalea okcheonensis]MDE1728141.1 carboxylating nicotinate-nucleotide diphosphorylase [Nitrososphaerota archaeon]MDE1830900.1 carboxylating nicotinate-nucleotide diphosphorylase [Nitrososphaerota archaeon]MDE1840838.1 carboxylating nicotinate-nucleotide diphosphorylase [Nitrososphaerota archaeon]MDE1877078.1 carboxylating nicotinate-nucleotide diphosphorylase [Nitrososphaerota archaeon]SMH70610.1 putative nicotinate-nucleo
MQTSAKKQLERFLEEDIKSGDITSKLLVRKKITATIVSRESGIVAGVLYAREIFSSRGCKVTIHKKDGQTVIPDQKIMTISGGTYQILSCERTALNLMSRMSGIANQTNQYVKKIRAANPKVGLYSTRKTAPGLRIFDKDAVAIGGGHRHRMSLDQMIMIKDNHIAASDSLLDLIKRARQKHKKIEVEVERLKDAITAATEGVQIIMLDNMPPSKIRETIQELKRLHLRDRVKIEASGGINYSNVAQYARSGVDMISIGRLTSSVIGLDLSLEVN